MTNIRATLCLSTYAFLIRLGRLSLEEKQAEKYSEKSPPVMTDHNFKPFLPISGFEITVGHHCEGETFQSIFSRIGWKYSLMPTFGSWTDNRKNTGVGREIGTGGVLSQCIHENNELKITIREHCTILWSTMTVILVYNDRNCGLQWP